MGHGRKCRVRGRRAQACREQLAQPRAANGWARTPAGGGGAAPPQGAGGSPGCRLVWLQRTPCARPADALRPPKRIMRQLPPKTDLSLASLMQDHVLVSRNAPFVPTYNAVAV
jgi:hypothetical protein